MERSKFKFKIRIPYFDFRTTGPHTSSGFEKGTIQHNVRYLNGFFNSVRLLEQDRRLKVNAKKRWTYYITILTSFSCGFA